jgi:peptide methionine sulfoxide reductase msrA/msrB
VDIETLLIYYFRVIDPTSLNGQGNDRGVQYRTGIYYTDENDLPMIKNKLQEISKEYDQPIAVEVEPLKHFYKAEDYHQDYLENNPNGYCHIDLYSVVDPVIKADWYEKPADEILKDKLTEAQYEVTQNNHTEPSFSNEYHDTFEKGIYVDVVTGEPLFLSMDKFESACGWPSFSKPIIAEVICFVKDSTFNMIRTEVRSRVGDSHLGHVFEDGPKNQGGLRFCINSASIRLVDYDVMEKEGYGYLMYLFN